MDRRELINELLAALNNATPAGRTEILTRIFAAVRDMDLWAIVEETKMSDNLLRRSYPL